MANQNPTVDPLAIMAGDNDVTVDVRLTGTYKRLRSGVQAGEWGVRVLSVRRPLIGEPVAVTKQNGQTTVHAIGRTVNRTNAGETMNGALVYVCSLDDAPMVTSYTPRHEAPAKRQAIPVLKPIPASTGPETFSVRGAAQRGDLIAGASAEGNGILTGFSGRGPMTRAALLATLAKAGFPAEWAPAAKSAHAHAGRILNALNQLGYVCRADTKRHKGRTAVGADDTAFGLVVANDAKLEGKHYHADAVVRQVGGIPTWAARWEVAAGRGREAEVGAAFGTVVMIATLDQNGELFLECDNDGLTRRVREDFEARRNAEEFQASDVSAWLASILVSKFHAARLGGNWYVRREYANNAERLLTVFSLGWGQNWLLPALPVATTEQLCEGLALGLLNECQAIRDEYHALRDKGDVSSRRAETLYGDVKSLAVRAYGLATVIGDERVSHLVVQFGAVADSIARSVSRPLASFASVARTLAPRR